jgi:fucose 4-O-acetylase-like acetyltransferase
MRVIAAFWVIYTHSGTIASITPGEASAELGRAFSFHVPFFLLASFYFLSISLARDPYARSPVAWWRRSSRLLKLHLIWVAIYTALHLLQAIMRHQSLAQVLADPIGFLMGGAAVHLYFIPLLLCGQFVLWALQASTRRTLGEKYQAAREDWIKDAGLLILFVLLLSLNTWLVSSGNAFNLLTMKAFAGVFPSGIGGQVGRVILVLVAHAVRCGPLVAAALLMTRHLPKAESHAVTRNTLLVLSGVLLCTLRWCPGFIYQEAAATSSFTFAYLMPLPSAPWTQRAGRFALGIYLMHQIPLEALDLVLSRTGIHVNGGAALPALLLCSSVAFASCWIVLMLVERSVKMLRPVVGL